MRLEVARRVLRLREPLVTAFGSVSVRDLLEVTVTAEDGVAGVGEAAPLEPYDEVSLGAVQAQLEACVDVALEDRAETLDACRAHCSLPQALAGIDLALWDLEGRRAGRPVAGLLSGKPARDVAVNALIGAEASVAAAEQARAFVAAAFRTVKVKVGDEDDLGRVAAVRRAAGPDVALRVDANGAWSVAEAVERLSSLAEHEIELCEEPVHGVEALRAVRERLDGLVPIAMDETAAEAGALESGAADAVCLKVARCGGISGTLEAARTVRAAGADVYLASTLDGPAGIAAALHVSAALGVERACGLATLGLFADCADPFPVREGAIAVPTGPGLGVG